MDEIKEEKAFLKATDAFNIIRHMDINEMLKTIETSYNRLMKYKLISNDEAVKIRENKKEIRDKNDLDLAVMQIIDLCLDKSWLFKIQNKDGDNIGMICACYGLRKSVSKILENHEASVQQNEHGLNIGMFVAENMRCSMENEGFSPKLVLKALDNYEASIQKDARGENIGIIALKHINRFGEHAEEVVKKALANKLACKQEDERGNTILSLAKEKGFSNLTEEYENDLSRDK